MRVLSILVNATLGLILLAGLTGAAYAQDETQPDNEANSGTWSPRKTGTGNAVANAVAAVSKATDPNCMPATLDAAGEGRRAYMRMNCYSCHAMDGSGGMGPNIQGAESGDISEVVVGGSDNGMPSFSKNLCTNDVANLAAYLRIITSTSAPTFMNWWEPNPTQ